MNITYDIRVDGVVVGSCAATNAAEDFEVKNWASQYARRAFDGTKIVEVVRNYDSRARHTREVIRTITPASMAAEERRRAIGDALEAAVFFEPVDDADWDALNGHGFQAGVRTLTEDELAEVKTRYYAGEEAHEEEQELREVLDEE